MPQTCAWVTFLHSVHQFASTACSSLFCTRRTEKHTETIALLFIPTYILLKTSAIVHINCQYLTPANQSFPHALLAVMDHCLLETSLTDEEHTTTKHDFKHPLTITSYRLCNEPNSSICIVPSLDVADIVSTLLQSFAQKSVSVKCCSFCLFESVLSLLKHPAQPLRPGTGHTCSLIMQHSLRKISRAHWEIKYRFAGVLYNVCIASGKIVLKIIYSNVHTKKRLLTPIYIVIDARVSVYHSLCQSLVSLLNTMFPPSVKSPAVHLLSIQSTTTTTKCTQKQTSVSSNM